MDSKRIFISFFLIVTIILTKNTLVLLAEGARPLDMSELMEKEAILLMASLPRGRVPRSRSSPCTNIPGRGRSGSCH
ncbi:unnamed protein product [Withania somnifera]